MTTDAAHLAPVEERESLGGGFDRAAQVGFAVTIISAIVYWLSNRMFDATRGDFFYLADAFLHGRTWLTSPLGPYDIIPVFGRFYVPFAPFPAIALMPLVAIVGPVTADQIESGINALLAALSVATTSDSGASAASASWTTSSGSW